MFFYPLVQELITGFYTGAQADRFVGFGNYTKAFGDPVVRHAFVATLEYAAGVLVFSILIGLVLATILNQHIRGRVVFRGILLVPYLTSIAVVGLLWRNILDPQVGHPQPGSAARCTCRSRPGSTRIRSRRSS